MLGPEFPGVAFSGFPFNDVDFVNYRGKVGTVDFIDPLICRFIARGVNGLFIDQIAPANYEETVNTRGQRMYAKQERLDFDTGRKLQSQHNILSMCTRPKTLIKGTGTFV